MERERTRRQEYDPRSAVPALPMDVDEDGFPLIHKYKARIDDLEHRLDYLERNFDPNRPGNGKARIVGEIWAIKAALVVMRYHELEVAGETSVITALEQLVAALGTKGDFERALAHAESVLRDLGPRR